jgi:hypothetical protein
MAIVVTTKGTAQTKSAGSIEVATTFSAGDAVFVCLAGDTAASSVSLRKSDDSVVRTKAGGFHDILANNAGNVVTSIWSFLNLTSAEAADIAKVVVVENSGEAYTMAVYGASGIATSSALDKSAIDTGSSTAPNSGATATLSQADELIIGACGVEDEIDDASGTWTTGAGNVSGNEQGDGTNGGGDASNVYIYAAAEVVAATTAQTAEVTGTDSIDWAAAVATYKGAAVTVTPRSFGAMIA